MQYYKIVQFASHLLKNASIIALALVLLGGDSPTNTGSHSKNEDSAMVSPAHDWGDNIHSKRAVKLVTEMMEDKYIVAKYIDDDEHSIFAQDMLNAFVRDGVLADGMYLKRDSNSIGWRVNAQKPRLESCALDAPWDYSHCYLQYYGDERLSSRDFAIVQKEWQRMRSSFGETFHNSGRRLLEIAQRVHATPTQYRGKPYIEIRETESCDYYEFLAFSEGYWLHVFLTDRKAPHEESIVTISFTPRLDEDEHEPPLATENLLSWKA